MSAITFTVEAGKSSVPPGNYKALYLGCESVPANDEKGYGMAVRFNFKITGGPQDGQVASRTTGLRVTPTNSTGKVLSWFKGGPLVVGESFDPSPCVGQTFLITIAVAQGGGSRVESAFKV